MLITSFTLKFIIFFFQEAFLLSLGCFNSFAAQRLLSVFKITEIISMEDYSLIKDLNILTENRFELMLKILKYK